MNNKKLSETQTSLQIALSEIIDAAKELKHEGIHEQWFAEHVERQLRFLVNSTMTDVRNQLSEMQYEILSSIK